MPKKELSFPDSRLEGYQNYLDQSILKILDFKYEGLYNIFVVKEPYLRYRMQVFERFPWIKYHLHNDSTSTVGEMRLPYKMNFLKSIDEGKPLVESIQEYFKNIDMFLEKALIKKTALVPADEVSEDFFFLPRGYFQESYEKTYSEIISQHRKLIKFFMPNYEHSRSEFEFMRMVHAIYDEHIDLESNLNFLLHKKQSWEEEFNQIKKLKGHFQEIFDSIENFVLHVLMPEYLCQHTFTQHYRLKYLKELFIKIVLPKFFTKQFNLKKLVKISQWWHNNRNLINHEIITYSDKDQWPALCESKTAPNSYTISGLTSQQDLEKESNALQHCVSYYRNKCLAWESHILSIKDNHGKHSSTVEIQLNLDASLGNNPIEVVQHRGLKNAFPSVHDKEALNWFLLQIKNKKIEINVKKIKEYKKAFNHKKNDFESFIGFDPSNAVLREKAFRLYHPQFIQDKSINNATQFFEKFELMKYMSEEMKKRETEGRVLRR